MEDDGPVVLANTVANGQLRIVGTGRPGERWLG
jgi:hypothetical protein